jgi:hypothetical protein
MDTDADPPRSGPSHPFSVIRAAVVLVIFVVGVSVLVDIGTRPSVSGVPAAGTTSSTTTTTTAPGHATSSTTTTTAPHSTVSVAVANATSTNGLAAHYTTVIAGGGWSMKAAVDASTTEATSSVYYAAGQQQAAAEIAASLGIKPTEVLPITSATPVAAQTGVDVIVVIGEDLATTAAG